MNKRIRRSFIYMLLCTVFSIIFLTSITFFGPYSNAGVVCVTFSLPLMWFFGMAWAFAKPDEDVWGTARGKKYTWIWEIENERFK